LFFFGVSCCVGFCFFFLLFWGGGCLCFVLVGFWVWGWARLDTPANSVKRRLFPVQTRKWYFIFFPQTFSFCQAFATIVSLESLDLPDSAMISKGGPKFPRLLFPSSWFPQPGFIYPYVVTYYLPAALTPAFPPFHAQPVLSFTALVLSCRSVAF